MNQLTTIEFIYMIGIDLVFMAVLILIMLPLGIYRQAAFAVMKRNFVGYFSNPTGYVFLCLFVLLTSFAAFWPHEFFTTNLANFDQLNKFLPFIMLVFIPAITMGIWAEERQQKTDELLLTLPALDIDIVVGKYFAAVLVFTVSLIFSQLSNYAVLIAMTGGQLDTGLLFSTYLGYWFVGIAMLALGMVASFFTSNLTVSFIFGVVLNAPLAFLSSADVIFSRNQIVNVLYEWSYLQRFEPFGRGLISPSSIVFFLGIVTIGIYVSLVLISRRHWMGGRDGNSLFWHFILRSVFLVATVIATVIVVQYSPLNRYRLDVSQEKISTLSPNTIMMLDEVASATNVDGSPAQPIMIDAYVSSRVPTDFVQSKSDLVNLLREIQVRGKPRITVNIHPPIEPYSQAAILAEKKFGIAPRKHVSETRGAWREEEVILGVAFSSGLDRVVIPFFSYGMPVEAELVRAIGKVATPRRKRVGIVETDAHINGAIKSVGGQQAIFRKLRIVEEIEKQYDVSDVLLNEPLDIWVRDSAGNQVGLRYDVLLVAQPSKMSNRRLEYLIQAIRDGQPTLIFEDPKVNVANFPPLTFQARGTTQANSFVLDTIFPRAPFEDRDDQLGVAKLWEALGIDIEGQPFESVPLVPDLAWSIENPYLRDSRLDQAETVIVRDDIETSDVKFNREYPATRGLTELVFEYVGIVKKRRGSTFDFVPLVTTGEAGVINWRILEMAYAQVRTARQREQVEQQLKTIRGNANQRFVVAALIKEKGSELYPGADHHDSNDAGKISGKMNCVYVADVDIIADHFVNLRDQPRQGGLEYRFENTHFVLNLIDTLANEVKYIDIRNRKLRHVTLRHIEATAREALGEVDEWIQNFEKYRSTQLSEAEEKARTVIGPLENELKKLARLAEEGEPIDQIQAEKLFQQYQQKAMEEEQKIQQRSQQLQNEMGESIRAKRLNAEMIIQQVQQQYKLAAVLLPPIPPLLLGLFVFTRRRLREREGISKARRLK
ncbi:MAG TPA: Gldg family protein [Pirellulaceae bacterium]|nr:Gldg family protein [Pirellulaceae bacterium]HMO91037.1 Gldg family protein [Pirellulaceae bacterium]HMP68152.1 Gldg family protein [Pirellulaceae bacterium]